MKAPKKKNRRQILPVAGKMEFLLSERDGRIKCRYLLMSMSVSRYLNLVQSAYRDKGGIDGQREVVKTATANRIRSRMAADLRAGAIIPPIVLGAVTSSSQINKSDWEQSSVEKLLRTLGGDEISIIDGMQRTAVLFENREQVVGDVRVELWLAPSTQQLLYRMLVLNTGQIPWNLRRQLEIVHGSLLEEIKNALNGRVAVYKADDKRRRTKAGEFQSNDVVEMYLAYNLRKPHVDKESVLVDQFSKLDLIDAVSENPDLNDFAEAMGRLIDLDVAFSRARSSAVDKQFSSGRSIFDKVSACAGFMAAYSQFVRGKIKMDRDASSAKGQLRRLEESCSAVANGLKGMNPTDVQEFLALETLREVSQRKGGALSIGEQERELFMAAFRLLFEEGRVLKSLEPCWRAQ
ncbi:MAG: hypothetical protein ABL998_03595 [Planctomycetota bacterium]